MWSSILAVFVSKKNTGNVTPCLIRLHQKKKVFQQPVHLLNAFLLDDMVEDAERQQREDL